MVLTKKTLALRKSRANQARDAVLILRETFDLEGADAAALWEIAKQVQSFGALSRNETPRDERSEG